MADYSIPSWLAPGASAIPAQLLAQTLQARDQVAMHKQQLEQAARQSAIETDLQGRKLMLDQERLAGESAHQTALLTLHQAEADRAQQTLDMQAHQHAANISAIQTREKLATEQAARQSMARARLKEFEPMIDSGDMTWTEAALKAGVEPTAGEARLMTTSQGGADDAGASWIPESVQTGPAHWKTHQGKIILPQKTAPEGALPAQDRLALQLHQRELARLTDLKKLGDTIDVEGVPVDRQAGPTKDMVKKDPRIIQKWRAALAAEAAIVKGHQDEIARLNPAYQMGVKTTTTTGGIPVYDPKTRKWSDQQPAAAAKDESFPEDRYANAPED